MTKKNKKLLIFDMDGTLYKFKGGSFKNSSLNKKILENARLYIMQNLGKSKKEANSLLKEIKKEYGENISIALEQKFGIDRYDYFNNVWDISAEKYIQKTNGLDESLKALKRKFVMVLLSDAPRIWIDNVLNELKIKDIFGKNIYSGEGDRRKSFGNTLERILREFKIKANECFVLGDQKETDIIPAKKIGMKTVFVGEQKSPYADYNTKSVKQINKLLSR